nr:MAG TPA: hypothetical protein [Caudoviricetes sp.]
MRCALSSRLTVCVGYVLFAGMSGADRRSLKIA